MDHRGVRGVFGGLLSKDYTNPEIVDAYAILIGICMACLLEEKPYVVSSDSKVHCTLDHYFPQDFTMEVITF